MAVRFCIEKAKPETKGSEISLGFSYEKAAAEEIIYAKMIITVCHLYTEAIRVDLQPKYRTLTQVLP